MPDTPAPAVITIRREQRIGGIPPRPLRAWGYSWTTPEDITWTSPDGTSRPGPRAGEYVTFGAGLDALRQMLRRKYGRGVQIRESWKL